MRAIVKYILLLLAVPFSAFPGRSLAQQPDFVVYYVKGTVQKINPPKTIALKKGDKLSQADWVSIANNAQLVLICKNYSSIKLSIPDTVKLNTLEHNCSINKSSFTLAYFHFVWDELCNKESRSENYMHNVGAVTRGGPTEQLNISPDTINYLNGPVTLKWTDKEPVTIKFFKTAYHGKPSAEYSVNSDHVSLDSLLNKLNAPGIYYWTSSNRNEKDAPRYFVRIWDKNEYQSAIDSLLKPVLSTDEAETDYMSGFLLEKAGFMGEAAKYYQAAFKLKPENIVYKTAKSRFYE